MFFDCVKFVDGLAQVGPEFSFVPPPLLSIFCWSPIKDMQGGSAPLFSACLTLIFAYFKILGKRFFPLISAYFSAYFPSFVQICTKNLRDLCFSSEIFPIFSPREKIVRDLCFFLGFIFFTHPGKNFLTNFEFLELFLQKEF